MGMPLSGWNGGNTLMNLLHLLDIGNQRDFKTEFCEHGEMATATYPLKTKHMTPFTSLVFNDLRCGDMYFRVENFKCVAKKRRNIVKLTFHMEMEGRAQVHQLQTPFLSITLRDKHI